MLQRKVSILGSVWLLLAGIALGGEAIPNWPAPATWSPHSVGRGVTTMGDVTPPLPFIGVTPCRVVDTRGANGTFGGPIFAAGQTRTYPLSTNAACPGFPSSAATIQAYSVNITVTQTAGTGFVSAYPSGTPRPPVSSVNFIGGGQTVSNAAIVPAGSGNIDVYASQQTHVIIDVNGYYGSAPASSNYFELDTNSGGYTMSLKNFSTTCSGVCGLRQETYSNTTNRAIAGLALGSTGANVGVLGETTSNTDGTAGVWGLVDTGTALAFGVLGQISSTNANAAGVAGTSSQAGSLAGTFVNNGAPVSVGLGFQNSGINYGFYSDGRIRAASLDIFGSPKNFVAPHPLDPSKEIRYASVEAPTVDVYFRGTGMLSNGYAHIEVPDHFRYTAREGTYLTTLTPVGRPVGLSVESEGPEGIVVRGSGNASFHYVVYAERAEIEGYEPVQPNVTFVPEMIEKVHMLRSLPRTTKALLVRNGTLNADGTYNEATARAMGWVIPEPISQAQPQK